MERDSVRVGTAFALVLCVPVIGATQDLEDVKSGLTETISETISNPEVFETNGFGIESSELEELGIDLKPDGDRFQMLSVTSSDTFKVTVEKGRPMSTGGGIGIFHRQTGTPMLAVSDQNGDGRLDLLTYDVLDEDGKSVVSVVDYEADGQLDLRINFEAHYFELWHIDRWYRAETRDGVRGIVMDGRFVELQRQGNRWIVP